MMDEKLQAMLDKIRQTAGSAAEVAGDAAYGVGKKTSQLLSVGKMNMQIADLRSQIGQQLQEAGRMIYATHTGCPTDSDALLEKLREIDGLYVRIDELEKEIRQAEKKAPVCAYCGGRVREEDLFCRHCGMKR
jgi:hypothetical protein